jgi:Ca-activated chloride channel family protein
MKIPFLTDIHFADPAWLLLLLLLPLMAWLRGKPGQAPSIVFPAMSLVRDLGTRSRSA